MNSPSRSVQPHRAGLVPALTTLLVALMLTSCGDDSSNDALPLVDDDADISLDTTDTGMAPDVHDTGGGGSVEPDPNSVDLPDPSDFAYVASHVFSTDDLVADFTGATEGEGAGVLCTTGCEDQVFVDGAVTMYPIDSGFGYDVIDYVGAMLRPQDGSYDEGWAGNIPGDSGENIGLGVSNVETLVFLTGENRGQWCTGLGGTLVKCKTNEYVTMQHVLTCSEAVPYYYFDPVTGEPSIPEYGSCEELSSELDQDPSTLSEYLFDLDDDNIAWGSDYSIILGENIDEWKYIWGNADKRPIDVRINAHIDLPEEWATGEYRVTRAQLAIVHTISNNPNDKLLPEGLENEAPEGRTPRYEVDEDGRWVSTVDCYEGDGDFIPAGTVLRNPAFADPTAVTEDLQLGFTNAWYTTLDRNPFEAGEETGPRWRLTAPKFGQALPGVDIPAESCNPGPLQRGEALYERGDVLVTMLDLLDPLEGFEGDEETTFALSSGWSTTNALQRLASDNLTTDGLPLTDGLDLQIHIKGDRQMVRLYRAVLYLDYEPIDAE